MARRSTSSTLYRLARLTRNYEAVDRSLETGDSKYALRRAKNIVLGRALGRAGVWRQLWR